jgi:hypothetical protein
VAACELARRLGFKERGRTSADYIIFVKEATCRPPC